MRRGALDRVKCYIYGVQALKRAAALVFRSSSMGAVFLTGIVITGEREPGQVAQFFVAVAIIPILVTLTGLEFHTVTDRLVANGMRPGWALAWLSRRHAVTCLLLLALLSLVARPLDWSMAFALLIWANVVIGLAMQEVFRVLVVTTRATLANALVAIRGTLPFLGAMPLWFFTSDFAVEHLLGMWAGGGTVSIVVGLRCLRTSEFARRNDAVEAALGRGPVFRTVITYLPSAVVARCLLTLDVAVVGYAGGAHVVGLYGNLNALMLALYTFADVAIVQWRLKEVLEVNDDVSFSRGAVLRRELWLFSAIGAVGALVGGSVIAWHLGWPHLSGLVVLTTGAVVFAALRAQYFHLMLYSASADVHVRRSYLLSGTGLFAGLIVSVLLDELLVLLLTKVVAWVALALLLASRQNKLGARVR